MTWSHRKLAGLVAVAATLAVSAGSVATPAAAEPDTAVLEIWTRQPPDSPSAAVMQRLADAFTEQSGIPTETVAIFEDFETKLQQRASQGDLPDIVINDTAQLGTLVDQGLVRPVNRDDIEGADAIAERAWGAAQGLDGETYAVPFSAQAFAFFIRSDWREAVGLPVPESWDDLVALGTAFTEQDPDGNGEDDTAGFLIPGSTVRGYTSWYWSTFLYGAGGDYFEDHGDGTFTTAIASPEAVTAAQWFQDLFCTHNIVNPGAVGNDTNTTHQVFEAGQAGIYLTGPYMLARFEESIGADKLEIVAPPPGPGGDAGALAEGENLYLMAGSDNEEGQELFAEFAASPAGQEIGMNGDDPGPIVRLPINTGVTMSDVRENPNWAVFDEVYNSAGVYSPVVGDWTPFRQMSADTLNALAADCSLEPQAEMESLARQFDEELDRQGIRA